MERKGTSVVFFGMLVGYILCNLSAVSVAGSLLVQLFYCIPFSLSSSAGKKHLSLTQSDEIDRGVKHRERKGKKKELQRKLWEQTFKYGKEKRGEGKGERKRVRTESLRAVVCWHQVEMVSRRGASAWSQVRMDQNQAALIFFFFYYFPCDQGFILNNSE